MSGMLVLIGILFVASAAVSLRGMSDLKLQTDFIANNKLPKAVAGKSLELAFERATVQNARRVLADTTEKQASAKEEISRSRAELQVQFDAYSEQFVTARGRQLAASVTAAIASYDQAVEMLSRSSSRQEAETLLLQNISFEVEKVDNAIEALLRYNSETTAAALVDGERIYLQTLYWTYGVSACCLISIVLVVVFIQRRIANPLVLITNVMSRLARGDTSRPVPFAGRHDEIGDMAAAVEIFRQNAVQKTILEIENERQRAVAEERAQDQLRKDSRRSDEMEMATSTLAAGLRALSAGDLSLSLDRPFAKDFEPLRLDFNASIRRLSAALQSVALSAATLDDESKEITASSEGLAHRTEQQAASLEQTAAALDEITANVAHSAARAAEAQRIADTTNTTARQSALVVERALVSMDKIEASSKQIGSIISLIEQIAFQTNLLALNAGVEAARAGEAGKGFAVVAQEVRELAQSAASATTQIEKLISSSTGQVADGVATVKETGAALRAIEQYVIQLHDYVGEIAHASKEQATALKEVNAAINLMDQVTQQNAAMVEENNAACVALSDESAGLRALIDQFSFPHATHFDATAA